MLHLTRGYTLIEVMVTMGILAVVAGIAIPAYNSHMKGSYLSECQNEVAAIELAEQEFFLENNRYFPAAGTTVSSTATDITAIETASGNFYRSGYTHTLAAETTKKLAAANCLYSVTTNATATSYTITATGRNNLDSSSTVTKTK